VLIGVPEGSVILPALFNFFTSDFLKVLDTLASFADDFIAGASDPDPEVIAAAFNKDLKQILEWAKKKRLTISADKSQVISFLFATKRRCFRQFTMKVN
jgi:hypothetical protein